MCSRPILFEVLTDEVCIRGVLDIGGRCHEPEDSGGDAYPHRILQLIMKLWKIAQVKCQLTLIVK